MFHRLFQQENRFQFQIQCVLYGALCCPSSRRSAAIYQHRIKCFGVICMLIGINHCYCFAIVVALFRCIFGIFVRMCARVWSVYFVDSLKKNMLQINFQRQLITASKIDNNVRVSRFLIGVLKNLKLDWVGKIKLKNAKHCWQCTAVAWNGKWSPNIENMLKECVRRVK